MADYSDKFVKAIVHLIGTDPLGGGEEGGYCNIAGDHGKATKFGISQTSYPDLDIANLTRDDAIAIYFRDYWIPNNYEQIADDEIALKALSLAANCGSNPANKCLQRAAARIAGAAAVGPIDGDIGRRTIGAITGILRGGPGMTQAVGADYLLCAFEIEAIKYHVSLKQKQWTTAWVMRDLD